MALGGVAIGNIKAQLLAIVIGINKCRSGIFKPIAIPATIGANTAVKATLLINSVINNIKVINNVAINNTLISLLEIDVAIISMIPLSDIALAKAKPPPNKIRIPQDNFWVSFQFSIKSPCFK